MTAVIEVVRAMGIEARDIQTSELRVEPRFAEQPDDYDSYLNTEPPRILGYIARNTVELRLRSLDRASEIIGALFAAGANDVNGPHFELDNETLLPRSKVRAVMLPPMHALRLRATRTRSVCVSSA